MKKLLSLCMILVFLLMPLGSSVTLAEEEKKPEQTGARISENLFKGYTDDVYKDKYYEIDTESPKNLFRIYGIICTKKDIFYDT